MGKMLNLEPIKARLAAATPGPWELGERWEDASRRIVSGAGLIIATPRSWEGHYDAELISHAPSDLAALVAEVELLDRELGAFRAKCEDYRRAAVDQFLAFDEGDECAINRANWGLWALAKITWDIKGKWRRGC
jgi:hypothetical protein